LKLGSAVDIDRLAAAKARSVGQSVDRSVLGARSTSILADTARKSRPYLQHRARLAMDGIGKG
jgi:hypothetical protein